MGRKYNNNKNGAIKKLTEYAYFYDRLYNIAVSSFTWNGLPDTVDERFLETTLINKSFALYFRDDVLEREMCLPATIGGQLNYYDIPIMRTAMANNGYRYECTEDDSVIIYENYTHCLTLPILSMFAEKLATLEITKDINLNAQKTPILIQCPENQRLTMENLYLNYESGTPVIYGTNELNINGVKVLKTDAPYLVDKFRSEKTALLYEAFEWLGVGSMSFDKKERMITNELETTQSSVRAQRESRLKARQQAAKQISSMFNREVTVEFNTIIDKVADSMLEEAEEVAENE